MIGGVLLFILAGVAVGVVTGLIPGLHVNTVVLVLIGLGLSYEPLNLAVFLFSVAITHTFLDFIPAVLLGVPSGDTALAVLPAHKLVLSGRASEAISLTLIGSIACLGLGAMLIPIFLKIIPLAYASLEEYMAYVLIGCSGFLILREKNWKKLYAALIFLMSGMLGLVVLRSPLIKEPLLPLLTGLFGFSLLVANLKNKSKLPQQIKAKIGITRKSVFRGIVGGTLAGSIVGFLPGFGPSQAAVMANAITGQGNDKEFLITLGGINTANMLFTLVALLTIGKTRSGTVAGISRLIELNMNSMFYLVGAGLIAGGIALILGMKMAMTFPKMIRRISYSKLNMAVIILVAGIVALLSGFWGLAVLAISSCVGLVAHNLGVRKMHLMGVLILPTIMWFSGF
ncbi:tripartite tricarboxylate transporter permease [Candidatus Undinarchaeota archaeon]